MDANRWQDPACALSAYQPLLGVALYVTSRGLTTSPMPYKDGSFEITFDFVGHSLEIVTSHGETRSFRLEPRSVAEFYYELMGALHSLGIDVKVWPVPVEVPRPVRFTLDERHKSYDAEYAHRFWRILVSVSNVLWDFRSRFIGKSSPVHFFWGSFDLAVTRHSGRRAPERPGADAFMKDAYSHEVSSVGFWPGDGEVIKDAAFYAYAVPEPAGFQEYRVRPAKAFYHPEKGEYFLMYDDVRSSENPPETVLDFCQSTYEAAAIAGKWDRANLDGKSSRRRKPGRISFAEGGCRKTAAGLAHSKSARFRKRPLQKRCLEHRSV